MLIGKNWKIESDSLNITLYRRRVKQKTKVEYWTTEGYFSNFKNALKELVNLEVKETGLKDFQEVVKRQDELYTMITELKGVEIDH